MTTTEVPGSWPITTIDLRKDKTKERDPASVCGSKHSVWIGIEPPPVGGPNKIIPYENNIVVAFWANDTSGGGVLDPGAIMGGIGTMITDPKEYHDTLGEGQSVVWQEWKDCSGVGECAGKGTQLVVYSVANVTVGVVGRAVGGLFSAGKAIGKATCFWCAESEAESFETDWVGLDYHNLSAAAHKVSIEISCRYQGKTRIVHQTELAGTSEVYGMEKNPKPALAYFVIDSPGEWKVRVKSLASGTCADPRLDVVETFNVAEPKSTAEAEDSDSKESPAALDRLFADPKTLGVQVAGGLAGLTAWWLLFRRGKA